MSGPLIKVCGLTRADDVAAAVRLGATAVGFVFWPASPRHLTAADAAPLVAAVPDDVLPVGVFVDASVETIRQVMRASGIRAVQLHGDEPSSYADALGRPLWRAADLATVADVERAWPPDVQLLLDAGDPVRRGGTGRVIDWAGAAEVAARRPVVLAGGLGPDNVAEAIRTVRPVGVDVSSGVERTPGTKDHDRLARFLTAARRAFEEQERP
ncbi:MAG: phosphoribosylanthranilate isomerase [Acidobacteria bacterium]|nr:phosphoribosylanthranilate isomerase [Acidobacteriota bacterium]